MIMKFHGLFAILMVFFFNTNVYSQRVENYVKVDTVKFENEFMIIKKICVDTTKEYCNTVIDIYYLNGIKKESVLLDWENKNNGFVTKYYPNGVIEEETFYVKGRRVGLYTTYFDNGKIKSIGRYKDINCYSDVHFSLDKIYNQGEFGDETHQVTNVNEEKIGKWQYFNNEGLLIKIEEYKE